MPSAKQIFSNDIDLVRAFLKDRSEHHFIMIYQRFAGHMYRMAMHLTKYRQDEAEDIVQDTWIVAIKKLEMFNHRSSLKTWLIGILINKWREKYRMNALHINNSVPVDENEKLQYPTEDQLQAIDIKDAINQLPDGYREILIMHDVEGYKHHEIAETMKISEGTSKSQLFHARKAIRKLLKEMP